MVMQKVTDPAKRATDPVLLRHLKRAGIDKDYVELKKDYAPYGPGQSPYSKRYRDRKSNKGFLVFSGLPMCRADGTKLTPGWERADGKFYAKTNLFIGTVEDSGRIILTPTNKQPNGMRTSDTLAWNPQLYLNGIEIFPTGGPVLLPVDPINSNYSDNTIEWDYGICKRRIRTVEGRLRERWIFTESPGADVRIVHNHVGPGLKLGEYAIDDDVEIIPLAVFIEEDYPFEISASATFYPDPNPETNSVDGVTKHDVDNQTWATIRGGAGTDGYDFDATKNICNVRSGSSSGWKVLWRALFLFYTASLPDDAAISAATFSISGDSGTAKQDQLGITPHYNIVSSNPASPTAIVAGDYNSLGTTKYCDTDLTWASWDDGGFNDWVLNATGIGAISLDGLTDFGLRDSKHDIPNTEPDRSAGNSKISNIHGCYSEAGAGKKPKLVVTYTVAVAPTVLTVTPAENITGEGARIKGNVTDTGGENPTRYLQYGKTTGYELGTFNKGAGGTGIYQHDLSSLDAGTLYYFRAYATNSEGTGYGAQADFTTISDVEKSLSASFEAEASMGRKLTFPLSATVETEAALGRKLTFPLSATVEIEAVLGRKLTFPLSSLIEIEAEAGRHLILPLSALIEIEAVGTFRAGIHKALSASFEIEAEAGRHLILPLSALIEVEAVGNLNLIKSLSALIEIEAEGELAILIPMVRKQQLLLEITTEEQVTH